MLHKVISGGLVVAVGASIAIIVSCRSRDLEGARVVISSGGTIVEALACFRTDKHEYPRHLQDLVPHYLSSIPIVTIGGDTHPWHYSLREDGSYELFATTTHFVSSYDVVLYTSNGVVPRWWREEARVSKLGRWFYVIGFEAIEMRRRNHRARK